MNIGKRDIAWNFFSTILRVASGVIVLPLVLKILPSEDFGLWSVFVSIGSLTLIMDFGFGSAFTRNVAYVFSGARELKESGFVTISSGSSIDYKLLKNLISVMKKFYSWISIFLLILLLSVGTIYILKILETYSGNHEIAILTWLLYVLLVVFQLYTLYFDSLLNGRGYIKRSKQITIISQSSEMLIVFICLLLGFGLISLVLGKTVLVIVNRILCYRFFYDPELSQCLEVIREKNDNSLLRIIAPNAIKIGLTSIGAFLITKSAIFIGSLYFSLSEIATYGISRQIIELISFTASIWFSTYYPLLIKSRVEGNLCRIKKTYIISKFFHFFVFLFSSIFLLYYGNDVLTFIGSKTLFLPNNILIFFLLFSFLESNHSMSAGLLLTKNEVPFFKAALLSGILFILLLIFLLNATKFGLLSLVLAPGIVQACYQNWKWPFEVWKELRIKRTDIYEVLVMPIINLRLNGKRLL